MTTKPPQSPPIKSSPGSEGSSGSEGATPAASGDYPGTVELIPDPKQLFPDFVPISKRIKEGTLTAPKSHNRRKHQRHSRHPFILAFLLLIFLGIGFFATLILPGPLSENKILLVPYGLSLRGIGSLLEKNGVVWHPLFFRVASRLFAFDELKSGEYEFTAKISVADAVLLMHEGRAINHLITIPEGLTTSDILVRLNAESLLTGPVPQKVSEGSLMPETYRFQLGDKRQDILIRMKKMMQETLNTLWEQRDPSIPLKSPEEAVILASVIEKETGKAEERARIAGVFYNRLKFNMRLQSDPTVIYAISQIEGPLQRPLQRDDLSFPSPINTYVSDGLPSQPICNPGKASLEATLHPEKHNFLYFVADGTGGHVFAHDLSEHNENVAHHKRSQE